jgi:hypothetical protein
MWRSMVVGFMPKECDYIQEEHCYTLEERGNKWRPFAQTKAQLAEGFSLHACLLTLFKKTFIKESQQKWFRK